MISNTRYDNMQYRRCGKSGLKLPAISLGMWHNFGSVDSYENAKAMVLYAFNNGITHFDLANNYGPVPGSAEETMGRILKNELKNYRDELIISSKAGWDMWPGPYGDFGSRKYLMASLDQSLKRLGLDYVDIFYHHRPDPETPLEESMGALHSIVQQGKALYVGISSYSAEETARAADVLKNMGTPCLIHQPSYNMFDRWIEDDLTDVLEDKDMGCICFSPLAQGLLTTRYFDGVPADSRVGKHSIFLTEDSLNENTIGRAKKLNEIAKRRGQTLPEMALSWNLRLPQMTSVIIGASRVSQIEDNLKALDNLEFSTSELQEIEEILK